MIGTGKLSAIIVALFLLLFSIYSTQSDYTTKMVHGSGNKKWTWIFYDDADFKNAYDPLYDFALEAYSTMNLNVIVLQDTYEGPAKLWFIDSYHNPVLLEEWGEVDMGSYVTLKNFIEYAKTNYPAERYFLSIYNHGGGWMGACTDHTNNGWLKMDDFQTALMEAGGVDVVCFTAPCLMGAIESVYELRNLTKLYIGSEELSGYCWWIHVIGDICNILTHDPDIDEITLGEKIIDLIYADSERWPWKSLTMSAIRTDQMEQLIYAVDTISKYLINDFENSYYKVKTIYQNVEKFWDGFCIDIYDFVTKYINIETNQTIRQAMQNVICCLQNAVINECHKTNHPNAHGLSIYFPSSGRYSSYYSDKYYSWYGLDFSNSTHWDDFLEYYFGINPIVAISAVSGGFGVTAYIKNIGIKDAKISWEITVDAPIMLSEKSFHGTIDIKAGETVKIKSDFVMGFGPANISVIAENAKKTVHGFIFGPFIIID